MLKNVRQIFAALIVAALAPAVSSASCPTPQTLPNVCLLKGTLDGYKVGALSECKRHNGNYNKVEVTGFKRCYPDGRTGTWNEATIKCECDETLASTTSQNTQPAASALNASVSTPVSNPATVPTQEQACRTAGGTWTTVNNRQTCRCPDSNKPVWSFNQADGVGSCGADEGGVMGNNMDRLRQLAGGAKSSSPTAPTPAPAADKEQSNTVSRSSGGGAGARPPAAAPETPNNGMADATKVRREQCERDGGTYTPTNTTSVIDDKCACPSDSITGTTQIQTYVAVKYCAKCSSGWEPDPSNNKRCREKVSASAPVVASAAEPKPTDGNKSEDTAATTPPTAAADETKSVAIADASGDADDDTVKIDPKSSDTAIETQEEIDYDETIKMLTAAFQHRLAELK